MASFPNLPLPFQEPEHEERYPCDVACHIPYSAFHNHHEFTFLPYESLRKWQIRAIGIRSEHPDLQKRIQCHLRVFRGQINIPIENNMKSESTK